LQMLSMSLLVTEMMKINFILKAHDFSISVVVKWILSACLNIRTLMLSDIPHSFRNEIARLKKLKELQLSADSARALKLVTLIALTS
jgi:hypothetical protein